MATTTEETRTRAATETARGAEEALAQHRERKRKAWLLSGGLAFGALAGYLLYQFFDPVNLFALRLTGTTVGTTNPTALSIGVALAFVAGVTMIFTPCGMPLILGLNAMAREGKEKGHSWVPPFALFTVGIAAVMAVWGLVIGGVGHGIVSFLASPGNRFTVTEVLYSVLGVLALLMALWEFRFVRLPRLGGQRAIPERVARLNPYPRSLAMGAALGGGFGVGCPVPTYQAILAWAALVGNPFYGAAVLAANALGRAAPLFLIGRLAYGGTEQGKIARWLLNNSGRARLINGTALAAFASLMLLLWGVLVPFVIRPGG